jgi:predicted regulator of Ras-like GTPase activity (Roadblock/LC7/MglB family)
MLNSSYSEILSQLVEMETCRRAALLTRSGSLVGISRGAEASTSTTQETALSAVSAALASSTRELFRLLGEEDAEYALLRGQRQTTLISEMPDQLLLVAVFPSAVDEDIARAAAEFVGNKHLHLSPPASSPAFALQPDLRDQTMRFLDELFVQ